MKRMQWVKGQESWSKIRRRKKTYRMNKTREKYVEVTPSNPNKITTPLKSTRIQLAQKFNLQTWNFSETVCYANNCEMFPFLGLTILENTSKFGKAFGFCAMIVSFFFSLLYLVYHLFFFTVLLIQTCIWKFIASYFRWAACICVCVFFLSVAFCSLCCNSSISRLKKCNLSMLQYRKPCVSYIISTK